MTVRSCVAGLAAAVLLAAGCGSSSGGQQPVVVRITDPDVAKSPSQSRFITDLYEADHGDFWRTQPQGYLVTTARIYCVEAGGKTGRADLAGDYKGLSSTGLDEFVRLAQKDICSDPKLNR